MSTKPFDVTSKDLFELVPINWPKWLGYPGVRGSQTIDADVSTVIAAADKVIRVESDTGPWLLNLEPEARHAANAPDRLHLYSTVLTERHELPVRSVVLLLRREANASNLTGVLERYHADETEPYLVFRYRVVRLWELSVQPFLDGFLDGLPLAMVTDEAAQDIAGDLARIQERLENETDRKLAQHLLTSTFLLMGLRYPNELVERLYEGVKTMEASATYQAIVAKTERKVLLMQGRKKFGPPDQATLLQLEAIEDGAELERLCGRILDVSSWQELFAQPSN